MALPYLQHAFARNTSVLYDKKGGEGILFSRAVCCEHMHGYHDGLGPTVTPASLDPVAWQEANDGLWQHFSFAFSP